MRSTPALSKEAKILKEKQLIGNSAATGRTTPLHKPVQPVRTNIVKKVTGGTENSRSAIIGNSSSKTSTTSRFRNTPVPKGLLSQKAALVTDKLSTPVNRNVRSVFGSSRQESATQNSASKTVGSRTSSRGAFLSTPVNKGYISHTNNNSAKYRSPSTAQNPIANGKDYSAQMARKAELGYSGAGYIVEWDCDEKELKYSHVSKGLWKITTSKATPSKTSKFFLGVNQQFATRLDVEKQPEPATVVTPAKSIFQNIDFECLNSHKSTTSILKNESSNKFNSSLSRNLNLGDDYLNNSMAQSLDLETSLNHKNPAKKSLRWADLEKLGSLEEKYSPAPLTSNVDTDILSPYRRTPLKCRPLDMNCLTGSLQSNTSNPNSGEKSNKRLRRSLSMNDINDIIITQDETQDDLTKNESINESGMDPNLTYSPAVTNQVANPVAPNLNETFELITPSKALIEKKHELQDIEHETMVEESIQKKLIMEEDEDEFEAPETEMVQEQETVPESKPVLEPEMISESKPASEQEETFKSEKNSEEETAPVSVTEQEFVPKQEMISKSEVVPVKLETVVDDVDEIEIPFSLGDEVMETEQEKCTEPPKVNMPQSLGIVYHTSDLVNSMQNCAGSLRTGLAFMGLTDENSKLKLNANDYIKISNLISDMKKSLEMFESKMSFE